MQKDFLHGDNDLKNRNADGLQRMKNENTRKNEFMSHFHSGREIKRAVVMDRNKTGH